ncbi:MAG: hypothetical protein RLZ16_1007 [Bacteroidota bacterium]|jgi:uncharacterized membrane protein YgdD (TMEM256/DUF423 family)
MSRKYLLWGIALAGLSVMLGAFGAHGLKAIVPAAQLAVFETGVRYEFMHALALILLAAHMQQNKANQEQLKRLNKTGNLFLIGILLFSGSLYALTLQPLVNFNFASFIGPITPIGGLCLITGWGVWASAVYLDKVDN